MLRMYSDRPADCLSVTCLGQSWTVMVKLETSGFW